MNATRIIGTALLLGGIGIMVGFGLYVLFVNIGKLPAALGIGLSAIILGVIILIASIVAERLKDRKNEKFEIDE